MLRLCPSPRGNDAPQRARYLSGLTLLGAGEFPDTNWSYLLLAEEIRRRSSTPDDDCRELYARAVFNALVSNGDDHPRNHAIIAWGSDDWRLSPLFDVVPTEPPHSRDRRLALHIGRAGRRASRANLVSGAPTFAVGVEEANAIIDHQKAILSARWRSAMGQHGARAGDLETVAHAIVPEGFEDE